MADRKQQASDIFGPEGWHRSARLALVDFDVAVHSDDPIVVDIIDELYAPTRVGGSARHALMLGRAQSEAGGGYFTALDGAILVRTPARSVAFAHLLFEANQQAIEHSSGRVRMHASGAAVGETAIVMPGAMGAGKSTLVAGLLTRDLGYLTDEVVAIDRLTGTVLPYAKPLSLGTPPESLGAVHWPVHPEAQAYLGLAGVIPAAAVGGHLAPSGLTPGVFVLPRYERGAGTEVVRLVGADALAAVAGHTFHLEEDATLTALANVLHDVPCYRLVSGDLERAVDAVLEVAHQVGGIA